MLVHDLDTPVLVCDLDKLERNIREMAERCRQLGIALRAHAKTHKILEIAHMQLAHGATGICCQKVSEAEVMVAAGIKDILIPFNIVGASKVDRLFRLTSRATITVAVDSVATCLGLSEYAEQAGGSIRVIIELDTGAGRCGVQSPQDALSLARKITRLPGIGFQGVMTYPSTREARGFIEETVALLRADSLPVNIISGGGTGREAISREMGCTETRSGCYVWEGMTPVRAREDMNPERCSSRVITTVVSTPRRGRVIVDAGRKTFASYPPIPYGLCVEYPEIMIDALSVEHGHVDVSASSHEFKVGERISFIPLTQELTINLHDELVGYRGERVEAIWPVAGRGKIR